MEKEIKIGFEQIKDKCKDVKDLCNLEEEVINLQRNLKDINNELGLLKIRRQVKEEINKVRSEIYKEKYPIKNFIRGLFGI